jgi:hypothetical protein
MDQAKSKFYQLFYSRFSNKQHNLVKPHFFLHFSQNLLTLCRLQKNKWIKLFLREIHVNNLIFDLLKLWAWGKVLTNYTLIKVQRFYVNL